jgi:predicted HD phosphohydrolase
MISTRQTEPSRPGTTDLALARILGLLQADVAQHGLQCAASLKKHFPDDPELQIAGLFHDIGHTLADESSHGREGAALVRPVFGNRVADLIELHVPAKRFLVTRFPGYAELLSADSVQTLQMQGSLMSEDEMAAYEAHPLSIDAQYLRLADDRAKVPALTVDPIDVWLPIIEILRVNREGSVPMLVAS